MSNLLRRIAPVIIVVNLVGLSLYLALDRGATRPTWATVVLAVITGFCAGILAEGWLRDRERDSERGRYVEQGVLYLPRFHTPGGEVELFTTTTPDAFPPGTIWPGKSIPAGTYAGFVAPTEGNHVVTRLHDLGSFADITGKRHRHWRVYGRPTE